jgi:hypothetical protein
LPQELTGPQERLGMLELPTLQQGWKDWHDVFGVKRVLWAYFGPSEQQ